VLALKKVEKLKSIENEFHPKVIEKNIFRRGKKIENFF